jgi:ABC-type transport system involved in multi-copper enzyme maturation permease subunit
MKLPALVERELRSGARRPAFYWLRGLLALVLGFQAYDLLNRYLVAPRPRVALMAGAPPVVMITGATLLHDMAWLLFVAVLLMGLLTADSISRERREGTLGLLLLTHLRPAQLVFGKLLSCGLTCFIVLLGCVPALMVTVLAGGVRGAEAAMTGMGLLNTLFVSLSAGLWMSAVFRERRHAIAATLGLVTALAFGPEVLGGTVFGGAAVPVMRLFGLAGWMTAAQVPVAFNALHVIPVLAYLRFPVRLILLFNPLFIGWFAVTHALGWVLLHRAAAALAKNWQDEAHQQFREPEPDDKWSLCGQSSLSPETPVGASPAEVALTRASWLTDPRPWDADPLEWRVLQTRPPEGLIWLAVALDFFAQFGALGSIFSSGGAAGDAWGGLSFVGLGVVLFSGGLLAWAGARFFLDTRRQQDLELLLTSPVGSRNILSGQWRVLQRALKWPLVVVLLFAIPSAFETATAPRAEVWSVTPTFLIALNLALEVLALCWVGMCFGLRARSRVAALIQTLGLVQLLPLAVAVALAGCWALTTDHSLSTMASRGRMPALVPILLFFMVKNLAFTIWAIIRLRLDLRLGRRIARLDKAARRFVLEQA